MPCPSCGSDRLAVRQRKGLEALIAKFTNTRKYMCLVCKDEFRAEDRRKTTYGPDGKPERKALRIPIN
jgi:DNA-directed RNA polymerase subunit RPC12/RpoP